MSLLPTASGKGTVIPVHAIKAYGEMQLQLHVFLTLALDGLNYQGYAHLLHSRERSPQHQPNRRQVLIWKLWRTKNTSCSCWKLINSSSVIHSKA